MAAPVTAQSGPYYKELLSNLRIMTQMGSATTIPTLGEQPTLRLRSGTGLRLRLLWQSTARNVQPFVKLRFYPQSETAHCYTKPHLQTASIYALQYATSSSQTRILGFCGWAQRHRCLSTLVAIGTSNDFGKATPASNLCQNY